MGRLKSLSPLVARLAPRVSTHRDAEGHSPTIEHWRSWYSSPEWRELRQFVFERDGFRCQCGCNRFIDQDRERIADHKVEHRGDRRLFFDPDNIQTLWKPHHDGWKQRLERARQVGRGG